MSIEFDDSNTRFRQLIVWMTTVLAAVAFAGGLVTFHAHTQSAARDNHTVVVATPRSPKGVVGVAPPSQ